MSTRRLNPVIEYTDIEEASMLRTRGLYVTSHRLTAINALQQHSPISRKKLIQILSHHGASTPTAHRIIDIFLRHKLARATIVGGKPCLSKVRPLSSAQIYKVCTECGQQKLTSSRTISKAIKQDAERNGYNLKSYDLQIFILCPTCIQNKNDNKN